MIRNYLKSAFLFLLFFLCGNLHAQSDIEPFEDYSSCRTGFRNEKGDTIFQAKFENVSRFTRPLKVGRYYYGDSHEDYWILSDNGKYGCLYKSGEWLFEPQFEDLSYADNARQFIITQNGKTGTVNWEKDTIFPFIYDQIRPHYWDSTLFAVRDNSTGFYTSNTKTIIPPVFDTISFFWNHCKKEEVVKPFCLVGRKNRFGIYSYAGKELIPPLYSGINFFFIPQCSEPLTLFLLTGKRKKTAVVNELGKQLTPFDKYTKLPVRNVRMNQGDTTIQYIQEVAKASNQTRLICLKNNQISGWYDRMNFMAEWVLAYSGKEWRILDTNFQEIYRQEQSTDLLYTFSYEGNLRQTQYFPHDLSKERKEAYDVITNSKWNGNLIPKVFVIERSPETKENENPLYGLFNLATKRSTPVIYSEIDQILYGKGYYWAFLPKTDSLNETADIFDQQGNFLRTIQVSGEEHKILMTYAKKNYNSPKISMICAQTGSGNYSLRWVDGSIPKVNEFNDKLVGMKLFPDSTGYYVFKDENLKNYFLSFEGDTLLNGSRYDSYTEIKNEDVEYLKINQDKQALFTNEKLEVLLDSCSFYMSGLDFTVENKKWALIVVSRGFVYGSFDGQFILLDSTVFKRPEIYTIGEYVHIDRKGKFISEEEMAVYRLTQPRSIGSLILRIVKNELIVKVLKTQKEFTIPDVSNYDTRDYRFIEVKLTDGKIGWMNYKDASWIVQPKYDDIQLLDEYRRDAFMVKDKELAASHWFVVSADGKPLTKPVFDEPFQMLREGVFQFAQSNGKWGVINKQYQWTTLPEYYRHSSFEGIGILLQKEEYVFVDRESGRTFARVHDSLAVVNNRIVFFSNDSIEITDMSGKTILKRMKLTQALSSENLRKLLYVNSNNIYGRYFEFADCSDQNSALVRMNNTYVLEKMFRITYTKANVLYPGEQNRRNRYNNCSRLVVNFSEKRFVERLAGLCYVHQDDECTEHYMNYKTKYVNYRIDGDSLIEVKTVEDLFLPKSNFETRLNAAIQKAIQADQYYGLACVDMQASIERLKEHFIIDKGVIKLFDCGSEVFLEVPVTDLNDLLRWKELFD